MLKFSEFPGRHWPLLLFGFVSVFWGNFGQSFFIGVYGENFKQTLNLSASEYGSLYSLATFLAGFIFLFAGSWIDSLPLKRFSIAAGVGLFVACVLLGFSSNTWFLFAGFLLVRLFGQSLLPHTGIITMARSFDAHRGKALSVATSAVPLGEIILPLIAVLLIAHFSWQYSWFIYASLIPLIYIPLVLLFLRGGSVDKASADKVDGNSVLEISSRFSLLKTLQFWLILPALLYAPFVVTGVFIHQDFIVTQKAWSYGVWASSFIAYGVVHWLSSIVVGLLIDKYSARKLITWFNFPIVVSMCTLLFFSNALSASLFLALLGVSIGFSGPIGAALWAELYGKKHLGGIRSMVTALGVVATAISPIMFGLAIDTEIPLRAIALVIVALGVVVSSLSVKAYSN